MRRSLRTWDTSSDGCTRTAGAEGRQATSLSEHLHITNFQPHITIWYLKLSYVLGFGPRQGLGIFLSATASRPALGPIQPPIQLVPGIVSPRAKRSGREANHSPSSSAEVKNAWSYTSAPQYFFMAWCLVKHWDFTITFTFYKVAAVYTRRHSFLYTPEHCNATHITRMCCW
jgi:hypothetical protein